MFPLSSLMNVQRHSERAAPNSARHAERAAIHAELGRLERLARLMDARFRIPGTPIRFGLDGLVGLVPGIGDALTALPALYLIAKARRMGAPRRLQARMAGNVAVDLLFGTVPVVGDLMDFGFKANIRNVRLLREHFGIERTQRGS